MAQCWAGMDSQNCKTQPKKKAERQLNGGFVLVQCECVVVHLAGKTEWRKCSSAVTPHSAHLDGTENKARKAGTRLGFSFLPFFVYFRTLAHEMLLLTPGEGLPMRVSLSGSTHGATSGSLIPDDFKIDHVDH